MMQIWSRCSRPKIERRRGSATFRAGNGAGFFVFWSLVERFPADHIFYGHVVYVTVPDPSIVDVAQATKVIGDDHDPFIWHWRFLA